MEKENYLKYKKLDEDLQRPKFTRKRVSQSKKFQNAISENEYQDLSQNLHEA